MQIPIDKSSGGTNDGTNAYGGTHRMKTPKHHFCILVRLVPRQSARILSGQRLQFAKPSTHTHTQTISDFPIISKTQTLSRAFLVHPIQGKCNQIHSQKICKPHQNPTKYKFPHMDKPSGAHDLMPQSQQQDPTDGNPKPQNISWVSFARKLYLCRGCNSLNP